MTSEVWEIRKLILHYSEKLKQAEASNDRELQEDLLDAIDQCFAQIAFIELRLASTHKVPN